MQKKKKKVKKKPRARADQPTEKPVTDQDARGHTGGYGKGSIGSGMKGNITNANKGSTGTRGR